MDISTQAFFEALYPDGLGGAFLEIRKLPSRHQVFASTIEKAVSAAQDATQNVYFGVGLRRDRVGTEEAVTRVTALWADVDWKDYEGDPKLAAAVIQAFDLQPSIIVRSGGGYHPYWPLKEPEEVTPENRPRLRGYMLGVARAIGGDEACRDLSRILRVPGTLNLKDPKNPRPVVVTKWELEKRFNLSDFDPYFVEDAPAPGGNGKAQVAPPVGETIPDGQRSVTLTSLGGTMRRRGMDEQAIFAALSVENQAKCNPPLPESEVRGIARSVSRYEPAAPATEKNEKRSCSPIREQEHEYRSVTLKPRGAVDLIRDTPEVAWLVDGILPVSRSLMLTGDAGSGKSWVALDLALSVDRGRPWLGRFQTRQGRVLVCDEENGDPTVRQRVMQALRGEGQPEDGSACGVQFLSMAGLDLSDASIVAAMEVVLSGEHFDLLIVDTLSACHHADENDASGMRPVLDVLKRWMTTYGTAICLLHHRRKPAAGWDDSQHAYRGSSALKAFVDGHLDLTPVKDAKGCANIRHVKARVRGPVDPFGIEVVDLPNGGTVVRATDHQKSDVQTKLDEAETFILSLVESEERVSRQDVLKKGQEAGHARATLDTARALLVDAGQIEVEKVGRETFLKRYYCSVPLIGEHDRQKGSGGIEDTVFEEVKL
ncbi:MAG: hypothetical protein A3F84_25160 [Candidatus Handelsmanbacteria bacterium RIFCSPLOWO2_12_FULL_64_10]|uniref:Primase C-terminal 1 domain-containing protein n=1 Tax=Handelsmanbacteria sp. (strain RIFCSPLOWO2_12_FULL_64_10) TaxID=1817868 RepID=A0A1F6CC17_HANXR|nr:MAG: hypothetical protein A3F84_25160 [Candidatus Handelsmanbacteria bacterium RIFCSPLOWO2_12_FULL_64_10]